MGGDLVGNSSVKDVSERGNDGEFVGELIGNVVCEGCLWKGKMMGDLCRADDWGKWAEKLQKLSFLGFQKLPSFNRQKDKILRQVVCFKKDAYIVIEHNSISSQFFIIKFWILLNFCGSGESNFENNSLGLQKLRIIVSEFFLIFDSSAAQEKHQGR